MVDRAKRHSFERRMGKPGSAVETSRLIAIEFPSHDEIVAALSWLREQPQNETVLQTLHSTNRHSLVLRHVLRIANGFER